MVLSGRSKESGLLHPQGLVNRVCYEPYSRRGKECLARDDQLGGNLPGQTTHMPIVFAFEGGVNDYVAAFAAGCLVEIDNCPECQTTGQLVGHGVYWRKPRDRDQVYWIPIRRWRCKACGHTVSALPDFLLRFRWYVLGVVSDVLVERAEGRASWKELQSQSQGAPVIRTIQRWWQSLGEQATLWLGKVQTFLAQQDSSTPWLDPQGEAAQAQTSIQALLGATGHLLAWAKTQWTELAPFGWKDRLRFLWLWGSGQGLERLV
jgi:hypothetical protein